MNNQSDNNLDLVDSIININKSLEDLKNKVIALEKRNCRVDSYKYHGLYRTINIIFNELNKYSCGFSPVDLKEYGYKFIGVSCGNIRYKVNNFHNIENEISGFRVYLNMNEKFRKDLWEIIYNPFSKNIEDRVLTFPIVEIKDLPFKIETEEEYSTFVANLILTMAEFINGSFSLKRGRTDSIDLVFNYYGYEDTSWIKITDDKLYIRSTTHYEMDNMVDSLIKLVSEIASTDECNITATKTDYKVLLGKAKDVLFGKLIEHCIKGQNLKSEDATEEKRMYILTNIIGNPCYLGWSSLNFDEVVIELF